MCDSPCDGACDKKKTLNELVEGFSLVSTSCEIFGSGGRDRTYDQLINSQLLYR